jgi:hypothetical protein
MAEDDPTHRTTGEVRWEFHSGTCYTASGSDAALPDTASAWTVDETAPAAERQRLTAAKRQWTD